MSWNLLTRRRDELPEMRWPLVVLTMAVTCLAGGTALWFRTSAPILILPFLLTAEAAYTLLILLWRQPAALAVPAGIGAVVLAWGGGWFTAVCCAAGLLAVSYVYASLYLTRERRFVRIAAGASAMGICLFLSAAAWISWRFDTLAGAITYFCDLSRDGIRTGLQTLYGTETGGLVLLPETVNAFFYQTVTALPALSGMICILLAALCDGFIRFLFWLLDCRDYFSAPEDGEITMPRSFGVLYGVLLFLVMTTSAADTPHLYSILSNCHWVFALPCAWVGLSAGFRTVRNRLAAFSLYGTARSHSPLPAVFLCVGFILLLGLSAAFTVLAVLGAVYIAGRRSKKGPEDGSGHH